MMALLPSPLSRWFSVSFSSKKPDPFNRLENQVIFLIAMLLIMVALGGTTRLTGSGLSIVEWKPITGILPPLREEDWQALFKAYQQTPEYRLINKGMDLAGFQSIFWLEFIHRLWGRCMGIALLIPLMYSFIQPTLKPFRAPLTLALLLGTLQGAMGWYMVKSGLKHDPHVNPFYLVAHLGLAVLTYGLLIFILKAVQGKKQQLKGWEWGIIALLSLTILYGGLVAGHKAGLIYNEFPLMGGQFMPPEAWHLSPIWKNLFFNPAAIQWIHRCLAILTISSLGILAFYRPSYARVFLMATLQGILGVMTLLWQVPVGAGVMHQLGAFAVIGVVLYQPFLLYKKRGEKKGCQEGVA